MAAERRAQTPPGVADVSFEGASLSCSPFFLLLFSQSDMAAERVVRKEDGEKLAKVKAPRLQSCRRRCQPSPNECSSSSSGVRHPIHGDQREDGSQRGTSLPRHCKVSARVRDVNTQLECLMLDEGGGASPEFKDLLQTTFKDTMKAQFSTRKFKPSCAKAAEERIRNTGSDSSCCDGD